ncbi:MAG: hypothetical protein QNJ70_00650 [Xenococcaceae cyanobacterium MO_207.B15]|nr:hypothetical protein [Xenococcaceae cyanobacterium MO_207.B15]
MIIGDGISINRISSRLIKGKTIIIIAIAFYVIRISDNCLTATNSINATNSRIPINIPNS